MIRTTFKAFLMSILSPVPPKILLVAATFAQTYLVSSMLSFVSSYSEVGASPQPVEYGWALVGAYALVYLGITGTTAIYWDKVRFQLI